MIGIDFSRWYWLADDGRLYSSAARSLIAENDADYVSWLATPYLPTRWPSDESGAQTDQALVAVLTAHGLVMWPPSLDDIKAALQVEIDADAERERLRYITPGAGQAMTYQRKLEQARAAKAATSPVASDYPLLAASIGIDGPDITAIADVVLAMDAAWEQTGAAIEAARLTAKAAIRAATDEGAAQVARDAVAWPG